MKIKFHIPALNSFIMCVVIYIYIFMLCLLSYFLQSGCFSSLSLSISSFFLSLFSSHTKHRLSPPNPTDYHHHTLIISVSSEGQCGYYGCPLSLQYGRHAEGCSVSDRQNITCWLSLEDTSCHGIKIQNEHLQPGHFLTSAAFEGKF